MLTRYSELQEDFRRLEGYSIDLKVTTVLRGLGFSADDLDKPTETFSGGWQMRIALAKLLLGRPGLLLLDEPTNHLDLDARNWLEEYLADYPHAVILVSHDRFFLDAVVTRITEIGLRKLTDYVGNYTGVPARARRAHGTAAPDEARSGRRDRADAGVHQPLPVSGDEGGAGAEPDQDAREDRPDRDPAGAETGPLLVSRQREERPDGLRPARTSGRRTASAWCSIGVNVHIERGDRIALIGPNGAGKSTMMRMLSGVEAPDAGTRTEGHQVVIQYFAQDEATRLDPTLTVYQTLAGDSPIHMVPHIRNILGGFLFSGDDMEKPVRVLSGGERTRLAVARMLLRPSNTLLLDEPTNHLDLDSKDVLLDALEDFGGTLVFVSHDRYFVDKLATKVIEIGNGGALLYPGNYEEFLWSRKAAQMASRTAGSDPSPTESRHGRRAGGRTAVATARPRREPAASQAHPRRQTPESTTKKGSGRKRRRAATERPKEKRRSESRSSKRGSPIASAKSRRSKQAMSAPGFYETTRAPSR